MPAPACVDARFGLESRRRNACIAHRPAPKIRDSIQYDVTNVTNPLELLPTS